MSQIPTPQVVLPAPATVPQETPPEPKPGLYTTEFWITIPNKAAGLGAFFIGIWRRDHELMILGASLAGLSVGTYNMSRGMAKKH